jgi:membrane protease YdiL (CAAX protease family)
LTADNGLAPQPRPWGRFATLGLGLIALLGGQMAALTALTWFYGQGLAELPDFTGDGVAVCVVILVSMPVQIALLWIMAGQTGETAARYLGLILPRRSEVLLGCVAVVAFIVIGNTISWLLGKNIVTSFQLDIHRSAQAAGWLSLLWLVIVVVTPIGEEVLFRGFLFRGWHRTPGDAWVVILVTAALFAIMHVQYEPYVIGQVFVCGALLGWFRWVSGSTLLTILMHGLINLEGMIETMLMQHG